MNVHKDKRKLFYLISYLINGGILFLLSIILLVKQTAQ